MTKGSVPLIVLPPTEGIRGLLKDGGSKRRAAAEQAIKSLGGRIEAF